jgi:K+-sensing histidine kinase KdpD
VNRIHRLPSPRVYRMIGLVRWVLPLALAVIAVVIEWSEHIATGEGDVTLAFFGEIALFAVVGPVIVGATLSWFVAILDGYRATGAALESMNRSLEEKVAERTQHLEAATTQLAEANADLLQLDRMKSEFVSLVSHQLLAPLTNINGALEIVAQDAEQLPPSSGRVIQILTLESQRLSRLIHTILDVSRIEAGELKPRLGPIAIEPLLARLCRATVEAEPDRSISLEIPSGLPPAWGDEVLVEEVVRNLLENALRHSAPAAGVEITAADRDGSMEIAVVDHGPGIPAHAQQDIFRSFHRLGDAETTTHGYGLGLYFAKELVKAQAGTIAVQSPVWDDDAHPGARFVFTLAIAPDEPPERDHVSAKSEH